MKSRFASLFLIVALLVLATAGASLASAQDSPKEVTIWHYWGDTGTNAETVARYKDLWEASQDECTLNIRSIPTADFKRELSTAILAGNTPDIAVIDNPDFANVRRARVCWRELNERVANGARIGRCTYRCPWSSPCGTGTTTACRSSSNTPRPWYYLTTPLAARSPGSTSASPPQTWDEFMEWAAALTNPDNNQYGITLLGERNETATFMWLPFVQQTGEDIDSLDSEGGRAALQLYVDLVENGYMSPEVVNYGFGDIPGQFMAGNAAMMINGPWVINSLEAETPDLEYTVAGVPYPEDGEPANGLGGENFSIFANSDVQDCAWDFITFTQDPENIVDWYAGLGFLPSRDLPEEQTTFWTEDPNMAVFLDQMQYARARGPLPNWPEVSEIVQLMLQEALTGQASVEEAISNAAPQIAALLGE